MTIEYLSFICFVGRLHLDHSTLSSFIIQMIRWIRGSSRIEFFIFLIAWGSSFNGDSLIFNLLPSFFFSSYETSFFFFPKSTEINHFLLAQIPRMNESHDPRRPFEVAITTSAFFTYSSTASSCSLIWETLVKYDCIVSAFWIFTFFNYFLKVIFRFMLFSSNTLVKESNISFGVFREETCSIRWSLIESSMIFLALTKFFLCKAFSLISLWNWNLSTYVGVQIIFFKEIKYFHAWKLWTSPSLSSSWCDRSLWNENLKWK